MNNSYKQSKNKNPFLVAILLVVLVVLGWHLLLPLLGIGMAVVAGAWTLAGASIVILSVATLLFFILPLVGVVVVGIFCLLWVVAAVVMAPLLFPIVVPLLIISLCIAIFHNKS